MKVGAAGRGGGCPGWEPREARLQEATGSRHGGGSPTPSLCPPPPGPLAGKDGC